MSCSQEFEGLLVPLCTPFCRVSTQPNRCWRQKARRKWKEENYWAGGEVREWAAEDKERTTGTPARAGGEWRRAHPDDQIWQLFPTWSFPAPNHYPLFWVPRLPASTCWHRFSTTNTVKTQRRLTSWSVDDIILRDVRRYLPGVRPFVTGLFFRGLLLGLLRGLLRGGAIVIVLIFTVVTLSIIFGSSFQGAAPAWPWILTLSRLVSLLSLSVPISVPVLLFVFVFVFISCHDSPRAFFCPLTAGPPWKVDSKPGLQSSEFLTQFQGKSDHSNNPNVSKMLGEERESEIDFPLTFSRISFLK